MTTNLNNFTNTLKKAAITFCTFFTSVLTLSAQNVGIGATSFTPSVNAMLDIQATDKGLLVPRVTLAQRSAMVPTPGSDYGLLVYQTTNSMFTTPGYYYWNGTAWICLNSSSNYWSLTGNSGTTSASSFLGTTDANDLVVGTNAVEALRIDVTGNIGIGIAAAGAKFEISNPASSANTWAMKVNNYGTSSGIYNNTTALNAIGIYSIQGGVFPNLISVTDAAGHTANLLGGIGIRVGGENIGIEACAKEDGNTTTDQIGGIFYCRNSGSGIPAVTCVGSVVDNLTFKIMGFGLVSTIVQDLQDKPVIMAAPEAPEALFQDFGTGQLVNGFAHINLDPILAKNIKVDSNHPLKVFIQLNDDCKGVFVSNREGNGFDVKELANGTSNASFSWTITATRKNETRGGVTSDYESFRFKKTNQAAFHGITQNENENENTIPVK